MKRANLWISAFYSLRNSKVRAKKDHCEMSWLPLLAELSIIVCLWKTPAGQLHFWRWEFSVSFLGILCTVLAVVISFQGFEAWYFPKNLYDFNDLHILILSFSRSFADTCHSFKLTNLNFTLFSPNEWPSATRSLLHPFWMILKMVTLE